MKRPPGRRRRDPRARRPRSCGAPRTRSRPRSELCPRRGRPRPAPERSQRPLRATARPAQPSEPILVPKLRIRFADFPYLHCSVDQRLFTLETCCGYGYGRARDSHRPARIFTGRRERTGHRGKRGAFGDSSPYLRANRFQGASKAPCVEKRTLPGTPAAGLLAWLRRRTGPPRGRGRSPRPGSGILT